MTILLLLMHKIKEVLGQKKVIRKHRATLLCIALQMICRSHLDFGKTPFTFLGAEGLRPLQLQSTPRIFILWMTWKKSSGDIIGDRKWHSNLLIVVTWYIHIQYLHVKGIIVSILYLQSPHLGCNCISLIKQHPTQGSHRVCAN